MKEFDKLVEIMATLRSENGCPWDRKQTLETLKSFLIEEAYETVDAIDEKDFEKLKEELGDLLLQIIFQSRIAEECGKFTIEDVVKTINEKMLRRHPHVFGNDRVNSTDEVLENWEKIKAKEREKKKEKGFLSGIAKNLPALQVAYQIGVKTSRIGFDWKTPDEVIEKFREEWSEFEKAKKTGDLKKIKEEIGDVLFTIAQIARKLDIDPEDALRLSNKKFMKRFKFVEENTNIYNSSINKMEELWQKAKKKES